ncbi:autotransporter-associated beta strand repeat-containing protein (plasmid) [Verrucomicrobiaceae bacterium 227]
MKIASLTSLLLLHSLAPAGADLLFGLDARVETSGTANNAGFNSFTGLGVGISSPESLTNWLTATASGGQTLTPTLNVNNATTVLVGPAESYAVTMTYKVDLQGTHEVTFDKFALAIQRGGAATANRVSGAAYSTDGVTYSPVTVEEVAVGGNGGGNNVGPIESITDFREPDGLGGSIGPQQIYVVSGLAAAGALDTGSFYIQLTVAESDTNPPNLTVLSDRNDLTTTAMALAANNTTELGEDDGYDIVWTGTSVPKDTTWTGSKDGSWIDTDNWAFSLPGAAGPAIFSGSSVANLETVLGADFDLTGVIVTSPAGPVSISGANAITLGGEGLNMAIATEDLTISSPLILGEDQTWNIEGQTVTVDSVISGSGTLTRLGQSGTLALSGANTFSGNVILENIVRSGYNGAIHLLAPAGLGDTVGNTSVAAGAKLVLPVALGSPVTEPLVINGNGGNGNPGALANTGGDNTWSGAITLSGSARIKNTATDATLTLDGAITAADFTLTMDGSDAIVVTKPLTLGAGGLAKVGAGALTLADGNSYSGDTVLGAGTLLVGGSALPNDGSLTINGGKLEVTGVEMVNALFFGEEVQAQGTWGASGSGATHIDDERFSGTAGVLRVASGPVTETTIIVESIIAAPSLFTINWTVLGAPAVDLYRSSDLQNWTIISESDDDGTHADWTPTEGRAFYTLVPAGAEAP